MEIRGESPLADDTLIVLNSFVFFFMFFVKIISFLNFSLKKQGFKT